MNLRCAAPRNPTLVSGTPMDHIVPRPILESANDKRGYMYVNHAIPLSKPDFAPEKNTEKNHSSLARFTLHSPVSE